jgi:MFS family permease
MCLVRDRLLHDLWCRPCLRRQDVQILNLKWSLLGSMLLFEVGSLICGVSPLWFGRAIAGLGAAGLSVGATSIIALSTSPHKRPMVMSLAGAAYAISAVLGPLIGGAFTETTTWRWCFYINLPVGGVSALALFFLLDLPAFAAPPDIPWTQKLFHLDPVGISLAMGAITSFILALQYGGSKHPRGSSVFVGLLVGCLDIWHSCRMGTMTGQLFHDVAAPLETSLALRHGVLPILLHGKLHHPPILPAHLILEHFRRGPYPIRRR